MYPLLDGLRGITEIPRLLVTWTEEEAEAAGDIEEVEILFHPPRCFGAIFRSAPALHIIAADADSEAEACADRLADGSEDFPVQLDPPGNRLPGIAVRPMIRERREKLIEQIAGGTLQFHAVKASLFRPERCLGERSDDAVDLPLRHGVRLLKFARPQNAVGICNPAGADRFMVDDPFLGRCTGVAKLDDGRCPAFVDGCGQAGKAVDIFIMRAGKLIRRRPSFLMNAAVLDHDQADMAALRTFLVKFQQRFFVARQFKEIRFLKF